MDTLPDSIEEQIRQAQANGAFDNLPGQGRPLRLEQNPFAADQQLAHDILRNNGFTLAWIEDKRDIETAVKSARQLLSQAWNWYDGSPESKQRWQKALTLFEKEVIALNKRILTFNLKAPSVNLHLLLLDPQQEVETIRKAPF